MKRLIVLSFLMMTLNVMTSAQTAGDGTNKTPIRIEPSKNGESEDGKGILRAPLYINLEAYYEAESGTITIFYEGQTEGEAYLYLNGNVVDYSGEINTTFDVTLPGLYEIEIITGSWTAYGSIEI